MTDASRAARQGMWALVGLHLVLLLLTVRDPLLVIDSGYHTSLGRYYAEHFTAFWDHINYGPYGRPNLQGPLLHYGIAALGWVLGGRGDDYVFANNVLALLQWVAAVITLVYFARRLGGDWAALYAAALFAGDYLGSVFFSIGLPSGWIFILTPWAVHAFLKERWLASALLTSAAIYVHLGGYATAPLGVIVAAALTGRWRGLFLVGGLTVLFTAPYSVHLLTYRSWYIGETAHVTTFASPVILLLGLVGFLWAVRRPKANVLVVAWALAPIAWLFQDHTRFLGQSVLVAAVLGGSILDAAQRRWLSPRWRPWFSGGVLVVSILAPLSLPAAALRTTWVMGLRFPRHLEWNEARSLAAILSEEGLDDRLIHVYLKSFGPALAVFTPITLEKGHWVEVQPRPDPAGWISAGEKAYVMPMPPDDPAILELENKGWLKVHGGTRKNSVVTLPRAGALEPAALLAARVVADESLWLADHAVNNRIDPIAEVLSSEGLGQRRARLLVQRARAGRIAMATLILAYALEADHPAEAKEMRDVVLGFERIAVFLGDELCVDYVDAERHERLRENLRKVAGAAPELGRTSVPSPALSRLLTELFDQYFWAAR